MYAPAPPNTACSTDYELHLRKLVELGAALMDTVSGPHFACVPSVGSREVIVSHAQRLIGLFEEKNINKERIVISVSYLPS